MDEQIDTTDMMVTMTCAVCPKPAVNVERCGKQLCATHSTLLRKLTRLALNDAVMVAS